MSSAYDSDPYCFENVPLFEALYGKNLISLGGFSAIDNMFSDFNLHGLTALDLGFGLGGVAFYLAQKYQMNIAGVEVHAWMAKYAQTHAPKNIVQQLKFDIYSARGEIPFAHGSFDMVYSKGVLNHVKEKDSLFGQVNLLLKPKGLFVIADWLYPQVVKNATGLMAFETQTSYQKILEEAGFGEISFRDDSKMFLDYVETFLKKLDSNCENIEKSFGKEIFLTVLDQHQKLFEDIKQQHKIATRIVAEKIKN